MQSKTSHDSRGAGLTQQMLYKVASLQLQSTDGSKSPCPRTQISDLQDVMFIPQKEEMKNHKARKYLLAMVSLLRACNNT